MLNVEPLRVFGIDPGLTRCGLGVIDVWQNRQAVLVAVDVVETSNMLDLPQRLLLVGESIDKYFQLYKPHTVAVERVFSQHNVTTAMGTAQVSGVAILAAAKRNLPVSLHTPTEVKAAVTGNGNSNKAAVIKMVSRILKLNSLPKFADAADALALALCHAWREGLVTHNLQTNSLPKKTYLTSAQQIWLETLKNSKRK